MGSNVSNKNVNIYIDQTAAEQALVKLQAQADKLNQKIDAGRAAGKSMTAELRNLATVNAQIQSVQAQLDNGLAPSLVQQTNLVRQLRNELQQMSASDPHFAARLADYQRQNAALVQMRNTIEGVQRAQTSWFEEARSVAFGVIIGNTVQQAIAAISGYITGLVSGNAKMSDSLADLQRVTGLTAKEAENLKAKLSQIDTRTSQAGLLQIAIVAGKLGVAKDDIYGFTKSVDELVVALGDELGNADEITTTLGKILNVFDGNVNGDNILKLGNAFVTLANAGVASGGFIADFTQRLSGIAKASNLSLGATVGLGAGVEELGGKVESSATAIQKLLTTVANDIPKAAKIAGAQTKQQVQEFANLFARAPEEALLKFAEGLTKNKAAFSEITASFKDAGEEGARTVGTLIQLGQKADFFREKIDLGKKSLQETNAVTDAFTLKNTTLGAELDKLGKKISAIFTNNTISSFFTGFLEGLNNLLEKSKTTAQVYQEQFDLVKKLDTSIVPLINRYDELSKKAEDLGGKSKLSKDEQKELNKAIKDIATQIPYSITQFDNYGNAIDISADKAREFIEIQKSVLRVKNASEIEITKNTIKQINEQISYNEKWAAGEKKRAAENIKLWAQTQADRVRITEQGVKAEQSILQKNIPLSQQLIDQENYLKSLNGENIVVPDTPKPETPEKDVPITPTLDKALLSEAEEFNKKIRDLKNGSIAAGETTDDKEITDAKHKYDEILLAYKALQEKIAGSGIKLAFDTSDIKNLEANELAGLVQKQSQRLINESLKALEELDKKQYQADLADKGAYYAQEKQLQEQALVAKLIDLKTYTANVAALDAAEKTDRVQIALRYASTVKEAESDVTKHTKDELDAQVQAAVDAFKAREQFKRDLNAFDKQTTAVFDNATIATAPKNSDALYKAQQRQLKDENDAKNLALQQEHDRLITEANGDAEAIDKINEDSYSQQLANQADYIKKSELLDKEYTANKIDSVLNYGQSALGVLSKLAQAQTTADNAELARDAKANDTKKANLKRQLDNKLLTQQQYQLEVNRIDNGADAQKRAIEEKQFKRNQAISIAQTLINTAEAAVKLWVTPGFPANIPLFAVLAAQTLAELAVIKSQKPAFADGGKVKALANGKIITPSNIPTQANGDDILATVKQGEVILNEDQQKALGGAATFRAINVPGFAGGGYIGPQYLTEPYMPVNYGAITKSLHVSRAYAAGGLVGGYQAEATAQNGSQQPLTVIQDDEMKQLMKGVLYHLQNPTSPSVTFSLTQFQLAQDLKTRILNDAGFK